MSSAYTIRTSIEGTFICGNTGSGKSSGSGKCLALKFLQQGYGGLVLTVKPDEAEVWRGYCRAAGRENDLLVIDRHKANRFNFLEYESTVRSDTSYAQNLLQLLKTVIEASEQRNKGKSDDAFWENALEIFLVNLIELCLMAYGKVTVQQLYDVAQSAPKMKEPNDPQTAKDKEETAYQKAMRFTKKKLRGKVDAWRSGQHPLFFQDISKEEYEEALNDAIPEVRTMKIMHQFFHEGLYRIGDKTRSIIDFCLLGFLHRLLQDPIYSLFCDKQSTFTPESCLDGKIIVLNLPVKVYDKTGQDAQTLVKYCFQKAWERRNLEQNDRPLFLWADEAQFFLTPYDPVFQSTARSSRIATVYLTQNLPGFYTAMGAGDGRQAEHRVNAFLSTLSTKIFHCNNEADTNDWASSLIGEAYTEDVSSSINVGEKFNFSKGSAYSLERMVRPEAFSRLKTGGPLNNYLVEAYIHCQSKTFKNGCNHKKIQFSQTP